MNLLWLNALRLISLYKVRGLATGALIIFNRPAYASRSLYAVCLTREFTHVQHCFLNTRVRRNDRRILIGQYEFGSRLGVTTSEETYTVDRLFLFLIKKRK